jgi:genome maintenance exonuclease 1
MMERYLNNEPDPTHGFTFEHIPSFNNLKMYATRINNILGQEVALYSDQLKIAGRCDVIAEYQGVLSVIDFKTSTNSKDVALIEDYFLQCTAYALMFLEMFDINIDQIVVMIAVEKGIPLIYKRNIDDYISPLFKRIKQYHSKNNK